MSLFSVWRAASCQLSQNVQVTTSVDSYYRHAWWRRNRRGWETEIRRNWGRRGRRLKKGKRKGVEGGGDGSWERSSHFDVAKGVDERRKQRPSRVTVRPSILCWPGMRRVGGGGLFILAPFVHECCQRTWQNSELIWKKSTLWDCLQPPTSVQSFFLLLTSSFLCCSRLPRARSLRDENESVCRY